MNENLQASPNSQVAHLPLARRALRFLGLGDPHLNLPSALAGAQTATTPASRVLAFAQLISWVRGSAFAPVGGGARAAHLRFRFLLQLLAKHESPRRVIANLIATVLRDAEGPSLFAQTELTEQGGLFSEIFRRIGDQILPPPPRPHELAYAARIAFIRKTDVEWLELITDDEWISFCDLLFPFHDHGGLDLPGLINDLRDAVINISLQAAALGLSEEVRSRVSPPGADGRTEGSPFVALVRVSIKWRDADGAKQTPLLRDVSVACHESVAAGYDAIERTGVSLSLVYRLETISALLRRLDLILETLTEGQTDRESRLRARRLLIAVVRSRLARRSLSALLDMNFDIFARRLVQHAGETGEHYIARNRSELWDMLAAAAGGGVVTVATTVIKFTVYAMHFPLFFEGIFVWFNYSGSFILMQLLGFTLATKQPSMTSAALADRLSRSMDRAQMSSFADEIAAISRSQFMSAVGNVGLVIPGAIAVECVFRVLTGRSVIGTHEAQHAFETLHPWKSATVAYAAITGVVLWLSSFGAGLLQNWTIYRGLPEAIGQHPLSRAMLGERRALALGNWIGHNASGIGGNLAIGFLLAFVPVAGRFFGLPLDIRHVTLTAGTLTFAFCSLGAQAINLQMISTFALSVILIGVMNFGVSTVCALAVAARARRVRKAWFRAVLGFAWLAFFKQPWRFFWPPPDSAS